MNHERERALELVAGKIEFKRTNDGELRYANSDDTYREEKTPRPLPNSTPSTLHSTYDILVKLNVASATGLGFNSLWLLENSDLGKPSTIVQNVRKPTQQEIQAPLTI